MRHSLALGSFPPMSSRHRNLEPLGRWHATIYRNSSASGVTSTLLLTCVQAIRIMKQSVSTNLYHYYNIKVLNPTFLYMHEYFHMAPSVNIYAHGYPTTSKHNILSTHFN